MKKQKKSLSEVDRLEYLNRGAEILVTTAKICKDMNLDEAAQLRFMEAIGCEIEKFYIQEGGPARCE